VISVTRKKFCVRISDVFFANSVTEPKNDSEICFFVQAHASHPDLKPFRTSVIDLAKPLDRISSNLSKNTRYKINRAEREGIIPRLVDSPTEHEAHLYAEYYDSFAAHKGLPKSNIIKLRALCRASALMLSSSSDADGNLLVAHAYVKDTASGRARLLYSASQFRTLGDSSDRNKVGRANRLLHWYEILTLKQMGFGLYDLGGLSDDSNDKEKADIARFKMEFGGTPIIEYTGVVPQTYLGRAIVSLSRRSL
jgi:hypothetical protein